MSIEVWPRIWQRLCQYPTLTHTQKLTDSDVIRDALQCPENTLELACVKEIDLHALGLTRIPPELFSLSGLEVLNLSENDFKNFDDLHKFPNLTEVNIKHNLVPPDEYRALARKVADLPRISCIFVDEDFLEILKPEMDCLWSQRVLWERVSVQVEDFSHLEQRSSIIRAFASPWTQRSLSQIRELNLSGKGLRVLPTEIGRLTGLEFLDLYNNKLEDLPGEFSQLAHLETVILEQNPLRIDCYLKIRTMFRSMTTLTCVVFPEYQFLAKKTAETSRTCVVM